MTETVVLCGNYATTPIPFILVLQFTFPFPNYTMSVLIAVGNGNPEFPFVMQTSNFNVTLVCAA